MDKEFSDTRKLVAAVLGHVFFWALVIGLGFWLGFPLGGLSVAALLILNLLVLAAVYYVRDTGSVPSFQAKRKDQLSNVNATELAWYFVRKYKGYRVGNLIDDGDVPEKSDFEDKEEARRIFKFEFNPFNVSGRACLFLALDQELSADKDDVDSLKEAAEEIKSARMVRSWRVMDYEAKKKEAREKLGMTSTPEVFLEMDRDGDNTQDVQLVSRQQLASQGGGSQDEG
mgnify:CR=1 FL=1